ncbi:MAG: selD [Citricoccus sp.]|nr:selD [Citricoccus sp. WCRC_4]
MPGLTGFEDRGAHQDPDASMVETTTGRGYSGRMETTAPGTTTETATTHATVARAADGTSPTTDAPVRLTGYASGGGCACKIPPGELEDAVRGLVGRQTPGAAEVLVGLDDGDDAAAVLLREDLAVLSTADFFTPMVDDAYDFGRIAAANALSDIYAMGGTPVVALNLVGWPRSVLPMELMSEMLRGGLAVATEAGCPVIGGHSIDDPEPKYGMAVTGVAHPDRLLRNDAAVAGLPITLTKPIGVGLLNNRHKQTGEVFAAAIASMTALNQDAADAALASGARAATDVTGFGLLGHLHKMMRASGVGAVIDRSAVPLVEGAAEALRDGFVSGGTRRNLDWVRPHVSADASVAEDDLLLLADAQTSGGLLVVGEVPGYPVIGETVAGGGIRVR